MSPSYVSILADLEGRTRDLDCHSIASEFERALATLGDADAPDKPRLKAECIAFSFVAGTSERNRRSAYFRPQFTGRDADGVEHDFPPLSSVDAATIEYWGSRAHETRNPFLQAHYADLVWDLSRPATGQRPDVAFARLAIDASLSAVRADAFRYEISAICCLQRALDLSISLRDSARTESAAAAMVAYEEHVSGDDRKAGLWGFSFDALVAAKAPIAETVRTDLLVDMENRLARMASAEQPDPPSLEPAVDRLLGHYRRTGSVEDQRRVLRMFADAVRRFADQVPPLMASSWLDSTHELLERNGMKAEADGLAIQMSVVGAKVGAALHANPVFTTVSTTESDNYAATMLDGALDQVFFMFRDTFIVDRAACEEHLRTTTEQSPLLGMISTVVHDVDGRKVASAGSVADDFEGRVTMVSARHLEIAAPFLRRFLQRFWDTHSLTSEKVLAFIGEDSIFAKERLYVVRKGLDAYATGDGHVASCVLLPEIEVALRRLLDTQGGSIYRRSRSGATNLLNLDEILRETHVAKILSEPIVFYLRSLLTDARGWNLRNQLLHGLVDPNHVAQPFADRVFHVLVLLGSVRLGAPGQPQDKGVRPNGM